MSTSSASAAPQRQIERRDGGHGFTDTLPLIVLTAVYYAFGWFVAGALGWPVRPQVATAGVMVLSMIGWLLIAILLVTLPVLALLYLLRACYRAIGFETSIELDGVVRFLLNRRAILTAASVFLIYAVFIAMFVALKRAIPEVVPFFLDHPFMAIDRMIHFGNDPWRLLQPMVGRPWITDIIDRVYYVWFPVNYLCLLVFAWNTDRVLRVRFYVTFWLIWIVLGTAAAYALSSAGPCYYGFVVSGTNPFEPLMGYLRQVDQEHGLVAVYVQRELWADYAREEANLLMKGISAMPSIHVALPILYTLTGWYVHRGIGIAFAGYAALILIGSVHLGWHYAIDGYVSALSVVLLWAVAGRFAKWYSGAPIGVMKGWNIGRQRGLR